MSEEDRGEGVLVLKQGAQSLRGDLGEGEVGGREDSERAGAGQGVNETSCLDLRIWEF